MSATYSTCALFLDDKADGAASLNPFTLREYQSQCRASQAASVCIAPPPAHIDPAILRACTRGGAGAREGFVIDGACMQAMRGAPDHPTHRARVSTDPLFAEAEVCRVKFNGRFATTCADTGREVGYDQVRTAVGANCAQCCSTVLREFAPPPVRHSHPSDAKTTTAASHHHRPAYFPMMP